MDIASPAPGPARLIEGFISHRNGDLRPALVSVERLTLRGEPHLLIMAQDVSERQRLEGQLRQAQKMEAIGQLAPASRMISITCSPSSRGIPACSFRGRELPAPLAASLRQIEGAAARAAELTRQLLAFSRRQIMQQRALDLPALLSRLGSILHRLLGENIQVRYALAEGLPAVYGDPTNLEQVVMNLAVNARDAMPRGGEIAISAEAVEIGEAYQQQNPEALAGAFVRLSVRDSGTGMAEETRRRIFEPFFTTKELHKGTGMGLATVYGIAKQHGGWVEVETALGSGSAFHVFLPVTDHAIEPEPAEATSRARPARPHTILVVEDDASVRGLVVEVVQHQGYHVLEAEDAASALRIWHARRDEIELVLTDIVMPGTMNGLDLGRRIQAEAPGLKVIYSSGYSADLFTTDVQLKEGQNYLPKPYLFSKLTGIIYQALEG